MKKALALILLLPLTGCLSLVGYYRADDAPAHIKAGFRDPRLAFTQSVGEPLLPIFARLYGGKGALPKINGFRERFLAETRPLDIVLARSPAGLVRDNIPSHFTHSIIWLGTEAQLRREELWTAAELAPVRPQVREGKSVYEASQLDVHYQDIDAFLERDEVLILRPTAMTRSQKLAAYRRATRLNGVPFDISYDKNDKSRLSCIELIEEVHTQLKLPVRYSFGRFATIPDDAARESIEGRLPFRVVKHYATDRNGRLVELNRRETLERLTAPKKKRSLTYE